jgi:hypothetical protein
VFGVANWRQSACQVTTKLLLLSSEETDFLVRYVDTLQKIRGAAPSP